MEHNAQPRLTFTEWIPKFLEGTENQNLSRATQTLYRTCLRKFAKYRKYIEENDGQRPENASALKDMGTGSDVRTTPMEVQEYIAFLRNGTSGVKPSSIRTFISVLTSFYEFLVLHGKIEENPIRKVPLPKVKEREIRCPKHEDVLALIESIDDPRDALIVRTIYSTGVRVAELCGMMVEDIDFMNGSIRIVGKGGKIRRVFPDQTTMDLIQTYLDGRYQGPVFLSQRKAALAPSTIQGLFRSFAPKGVTPHTIRHSHATELYKNSHDLRLVQKSLGHTSSRTTEIYLHSNQDELKDAIHRAFPLHREHQCSSEHQ